MRVVLALVFLLNAQPALACHRYHSWRAAQSLTTEEK